MWSVRTNAMVDEGFATAANSSIEDFNRACGLLKATQACTTGGPGVLEVVD